MSDITTQTIGKLLDDTMRRDAVHIALAPMVAADQLSPGQHVGIQEDGRAGIVKEPIGIVDPFLSGLVPPGERFWLFLYPMTITSLRHEWTHPAFPTLEHHLLVGEGTKAASEAWLRDFVARSDCPGYEAVIAAAIDHRAYQWDSLYFDGRDAHGEIPPEFWDHVEIVTGKAIPHNKRASYFSCSC